MPEPSQTNELSHLQCDDGDVRPLIDAGVYTIQVFQQGNSMTASYAVTLARRLVLRGAECQPRAVGFACTATEGSPGTIQFAVANEQGPCIDAGDGPIARICLTDGTAACREGQVTSLELGDVQVDDCEGQDLPASRAGGTLFCGEDLGCDCKANGNVDLFDVLLKIDVLLERMTPTALQRALCDDDCSGRVDVFDILREIDVLLERIPRPLDCRLAAENG